jgi:hypothetical protein
MLSCSEHVAPLLLLLFTKSLHMHVQGWLENLYRETFHNMGLIGSALVEGVPMVTAFSRFVFGGEAKKNKKRG